LAHHYTVVKLALSLNLNANVHFYLAVNSLDGQPSIRSPADSHLEERPHL
jgi:hypothetical protein